MTPISIPAYGTIRLNSYRPLCRNEFGREAIKNSKGAYPDYIDSSCRREPDFQNPSPSITALCRAGKLAPHLKVNDIVVYMTVKDGDYPRTYDRSNRLVAILQVEQVFNSHEEAALAYSALGLRIPSNCMIEGSMPLNYDQTGGNFDNNFTLEDYKDEAKREERLKGWNTYYMDKLYRPSKPDKAGKLLKFVKTNPL